MVSNSTPTSGDCLTDISPAEPSVGPHVLRFLSLGSLLSERTPQAFSSVAPSHFLSAVCFPGQGRDFTTLRLANLSC